MDTDIGAGSPSADDSSDAADTAPLPVLNAFPGMLSEPGPFAAPEQEFGRPPFLDEPAFVQPHSPAVEPSGQYPQWPSHEHFSTAAPGARGRRAEVLVTRPLRILAARFHRGRVWLHERRLIEKRRPAKLLFRRGERTGFRQHPGKSVKDR